MPEQDDLYAEILRAIEELHANNEVSDRLNALSGEIQGVRNNVRDAHRRIDGLEDGVRRALTAALGPGKKWFQEAPWKHVIYVLLGLLVLGMSQLRWINLGDVDTGLGWWDRIAGSGPAPGP